VQVVEIAASLLPSRAMHTRSTSREIRVPGGKSSGFPIANRAFGPYVTRGLKKNQFEAAANTTDPNIPTLVSHASSRRRGMGASFAGCVE
jgi:hypothetical protein